MKKNFLKLRQYGSFNPTQKNHTQHMESLCKNIEAGNIVLPIFQTGLRWTQEKNVALLNFILKSKAPVSPISMNVIGTKEKAVEQVFFINRDLIKENLLYKQSVIDGQQRLTCLYKAYINHESFHNIVFDVSRVTFQMINKPIKDYQIPVGILLNKLDTEFYQYMNSNPFLKKDIIKDGVLSVRKKFYGYSFIINLSEDLDEKEQISWFEVLNSAGSKVSSIEMKFAKILVQDIDVFPEYINPFNEKVINEGWGNLFSKKKTEVSMPIAALNPAYEVIIRQSNHLFNCSPIPSDENTDQLVKLEPDVLRKLFRLTLDALDFSIDFIKNNNLKKPKRMDYITFLMGIFIFNGSSTLNESQINKLINWYKNVSFRNRTHEDRRKEYDTLLKDVVLNKSLINQYKKFS